MLKWFKKNYIYILILILAIVGRELFRGEEPKFTFEFSNPIEGDAAMSRLFVQDDILYMSWVEETDSLAILKYSTFNGSKWTEPEMIAQGHDWFVNWADFPTIAVNNGNIFAHYLQKSAPDTYAYDVMYRVFNASNEKWTAPQKLHQDSTKSEHGFVSVIPYGDGFMASWLDGRTTVNRPDSLKQMTIRAGIIHADGSLGQQWELDQRVCDCCSTSITETLDGPMVTYRDRTDDEIRDIYAVRLLEDQTWSAPAAVYNDNWQINGCPVNGPAIASNGMTAVAWFTKPAEMAKVKVAFKGSSDWFDEVLVLQDAGAIGRVDVAVDQYANTYVLYMKSFGDMADLILTHISNTGERMNHILASITAERASGFPQLELFDERAIISFTDTDSTGSRVRTLAFPYKSFLE